MQFFLAYPDPNLGNRLVKDLRKIRRTYLRSWFAVDFCSSLPFDLVGLILKNQTNTKNAMYLRVIRLIRLSRTRAARARTSARSSMMSSNLLSPLMMEARAGSLSMRPMTLLP